MRNAAQARANEISVGSPNPFNVQLDALNISYSKVMQHTYQCFSEEEAPTADSLYTSFISSAQLNFLSEISKQDYTRIGVGITMKDNWYYVVVYLVK
ncbi:MAG: hypothetical protein GX851_02445 [Clostridiales bacterium]|nr:hypothetical protein [Clostridiales bacterium]